ncbi:MAG: SM-20-related protein [Halioglobus sp.]|jgi:SM-20-related protein
MKLCDQVSPHAWKASFEECGRVHIANFLAGQSAQQIYDCLSQQEKWNLVFQTNNKHTDVDADSWSQLDDDQLADFKKIVFAQAQQGFQYLNKNIPIYDVYHKKLMPNHFFNTIFEFLNGEEFLDFCRVLTSEPEIGFADAQATCYSPGHFLNHHDDNIYGKDRVAAYVLNMTPAWDRNWGGALQFFDNDGHVEEAYMPKFNALNVFRIPKSHSVSYVTPFAGASRFSITGWLRKGQDPLKS